MLNVLRDERMELLDHEMKGKLAVPVGMEEFLGA
jgi:hypothetical protein